MIEMDPRIILLATHMGFKPSGKSGTEISLGPEGDYCKHYIIVVNELGYFTYVPMLDDGQDTGQRVIHGTVEGVLKFLEEDVNV